MGQLLFFYGDECGVCHQMMPLVDKLEIEGTTVTRLEVYHHAGNLKKMQDLAEGAMGLPLFVNPSTKKVLSGKVEYDQLKELSQ